MAITTVSSREFNQNTSRIKKAARKGPVFITDRGRAAQVLLSIEEYNRLTGKGKTLLDILQDADGGDFPFDPPKLQGPLSRPVSFDED